MHGVIEPASLCTERTSRPKCHRRQKFRMAGESDKKLAQHREEQRQLERRARYGAAAPIGPQRSARSPPRT